MNKHEFNEIASLNSENLDVEELERRLELATTVGDLMDVDWVCNDHHHCATLCSVVYSVPK